MGRNQTFTLWLVVIVALVTVLGGCTGLGPQAPATQAPVAAEAPVKLTYAGGLSMSFALELIAIQKGYFAEQGLELNVVNFATGREGLQAVLGGAAELGSAAATPLVFSTFQNQPAAVVAVTGRNSKSRLLARAESGIRTAADLRGKKVGVSVGTDLHYFLDAMLEANGLTEADITVVNVAPPDMVASLTRGDVDAISTWEPNVWKAAQALGDKAIELMDPPGLYTADYLLVSRQDWAAANQKTIAKFLTAIAKAEDFLKNNTAEAQTMVAQATSTDIEIVKGTWDRVDYGLQLGPSLMTDMEQQAQWAIDTDRGPAGVTAIPDFSKLMYPAALKEVKPQVVTLP